jgi:MFS transporter, ACS family, allantoate permease
MTEGCITPGIVLVTSMFYTRTEMGERVGWTFQCNGFASIISGFIAFGAYHAPARTPTTPQKVNQWQWFFIIIALMTFIVFLAFILLFPDNPTRANFLTEREKIVAVRRTRTNQSGIETKTFKKYQYVLFFFRIVSYIPSDSCDSSG